MKIQMRNTVGEVAGSIEVRDDVFGAPPNPALVHQVLVGQLANARQGTAATQTRGHVSGGGRKPRTQKHTGLARAGTTRAPHWKGGGVAFGPAPRSYRQRTPKRMRRLSLVTALSDKVREEQLVVLDGLTLEQAKTKEMVRVLNALDAGYNLLLVADGADPTVLRSARNIPKLTMLPASLLNTADLLRHRKVVMTQEAVRRTEELWGGDRLRGKRSRDSEVADADA